MLNVRLSLALGLTLVSLVSASPGLAAPAPAPKPVSGVKTSSGWLRTGEAHQEKGEHAQAGNAYRKALESLPPQKQVANEGAKAAGMSADAHWLAFEQDLDVLHLQAALDVLNLWLTLTGPRSRASMLGDVERKISRIQAVREPLVEAAPALAAGDVKKAAELHREAADTLANQRYEWPLGARVVLQVSVGGVAAYDRDKEAGKDIRAYEPGLVAIRDLLVEWKGKRPADDASEQGDAVDKALTDVEARLAEVEQAKVDMAETERIAAEKAKADEAKRLEDERIAAEQAEAERKRKAEEARKKRGLAIGLLAGGVVAAGAGAGLVGEGLVGNRVFKDGAAEQRDLADMLAMANPGYPREEFDADYAKQDAANRRRTLGMAIGGSVLVAGGLGMAIYGIVTLAQGRERRGAKQRARLEPGPFLVNVAF